MDALLNLQHIQAKL